MSWKCQLCEHENICLGKGEGMDMVAGCVIHHALEAADSIHLFKLELDC